MATKKKTKKRSMWSPLASRTKREYILASVLVASLGVLVLSILPLEKRITYLTCAVAQQNLPILRCENTEVVCYTLGTTLECKFK